MQIKPISQYTVGYAIINNLFIGFKGINSTASHKPNERIFFIFG